MTSGRHALYARGYTGATVPWTVGGDPERGSKSRNQGEVRIGGCNSPP